METEDFFQFTRILIILVSYFQFNWIPMLCVYDQHSAYWVTLRYKLQGDRYDVMMPRDDLRSRRSHESHLTEVISLTLSNISWGRGSKYKYNMTVTFFYAAKSNSRWAGALGWWLAPLPFTPEFGVRFPVSAVWKKQKMFLPHPRVKVSIVGSLRDREVACSASDRQRSNFEFCVWRTVSSQSSHHSQEVLLAQFSLYVHKGGVKPDSFNFISNSQ